MNIAPQLGVAQTTCVINQAFTYGIDIKDFVDLSYSSGKWKKWFSLGESASPLEAAIVSGHYHFASDIYKKMIDSLSKFVDIEDILIKKITEVIHHYENSSKALGL